MYMSLALLWKINNHSPRISATDEFLRKSLRNNAFSQICQRQMVFLICHSEHISVVFRSNYISTPSRTYLQAFYLLIGHNRKWCYWFSQQPQAHITNILCPKVFFRVCTLNSNASKNRKINFFISACNRVPFTATAQKKSGKHFCLNHLFTFYINCRLLIFGIWFMLIN